MNIYWINIEVNFDDDIPIINTDDNETLKNAQGFFQEFGCTDANENDAKNLINEYLKETNDFKTSKMKTNFNRVATINFNDIDSEIYGDDDIKDSLLSNPTLKGIWYASGRAFFSDQLDDDEFYGVEL